jgi:hypothetical protein
VGRVAPKPRPQYRESHPFWVMTSPNLIRRFEPEVAFGPRGVASVGTAMTTDQILLGVGLTRPGTQAANGSPTRSD